MSVRSRRLRQHTRVTGERLRIRPRLWHKVGRSCDRWSRDAGLRPYLCRPKWCGVCVACGLVNFEDPNMPEHGPCYECGGTLERLGGAQRKESPRG